MTDGDIVVLNAADLLGSATTTYSIYCLYPTVHHFTYLSFHSLYFFYHCGSGKKVERMER
jgi:hypothetical protein